MNEWKDMDATLSITTPEIAYWVTGIHKFAYWIKDI
jgi:hypothetical protein